MKSIFATLAVAAIAACVDAQGFVRSQNRKSVIKSVPPSEIYSPEALPATYDVRETLKSMGAQISTARNQHIP